MEHNPFLAYLRDHDDAGPQTLKDLFRLLAKRTHPDLGADDATQFVRLQEHYHQALAELLAAEGGRAVVGSDGGQSARELVLGALYRYKSRLPHLQLDGRDLPVACRRTFDAALAASSAYDRRARLALHSFDEQFHRDRAINARYPDVSVKYSSLIRGLCGFFDYQVIPNEFNARVTRSYLAEIRPVTDFDPAASPLLRHNRSAAARSALFRMRTWLEAELELPVCNLL